MTKLEHDMMWLSHRGHLLPPQTLRDTEEWKQVWFSPRQGFHPWVWSLCLLSFFWGADICCFPLSLLQPDGTIKQTPAHFLMNADKATYETDGLWLYGAALSVFNKPIILVMTFHYWSFFFIPHKQTKSSLSVLDSENINPVFILLLQCPAHPSFSSISAVVLHLPPWPFKVLSGWR